MAFFSRPNLEDLQFKQTKNSVLSLSGQTRINNWSGLTLTDGDGNYIPITLSGASTATTQGYVLTFINGLVSLQPSSSSGGTYVFDTDRYTTRSGIPSVCVGGACTINNFLEEYFFPAVPPTSSLSIISGGVNREFGDCSYGNLCYSVIRCTNPIESASIDTNADGSYNYPIVGACPNGANGTVAYTYPSSCAVPPSGTSQSSVTFSLTGKTVCSETTTSNASITWRNRVYGLKSSVLYTDDSISAALGGAFISELSTTKQKTLSNQTFNNEFFYWVYPSSFGVPSFIINGLPNNAWGNIVTGTLFTINYTNAHGYLNQYYVARSDNRITGTYNIVIS